MLVDLLIVLVAARLAGEAVERFGIPAVVGEIVAGAIIGPSVLGLVHPTESLAGLAEIGVILLLLNVGLETDLRELGTVGAAALAVAVVGVALPMAGGIAVTMALGHDGTTALFVGAALTATSVGITARVFADLGILASVEARIVLGAAVADDVLGLLLLAGVVAIADQGSLPPGELAGMLGGAAAFLVLGTIAAVWLAPRLLKLAHVSSHPGTVVIVALAFTLALARVAEAAELAPIIGAFVAGVAMARTPHAHKLSTDLAPLGHFLVPVFFLQIGLQADLGRMGQGEVLGMAGLLLAVAVAGKVLACVGAWRAARDRLLVGVGMLPRGEVGLIFAGLGLQRGVLDADLYGALLAVVLATTLVAPPLLRTRAARLAPAAA